MKLASTVIYMVCVLTVGAVKAQTCVNAQPYMPDTLATKPPRLTEHTWLWGAGPANVLDTYLSPLEYTGTNFGVVHHTERSTRRGSGRVHVHSLYTGHLSYLHSPTDDGKEWDAEFSAAGGWLYNWSFGGHWRMALGGLAELSGGFTYNTRGSNNPAQGRLGISIAASSLCEYRFKFFRRDAAARLTADVQALGMQFSPQYGQSYYEIFSLGHTGGIIHLTHPVNCPSGRLLTQVTLPVGQSKFTISYLGDVRQSKLGGLKRHAWRNIFMLGFTRQLHIHR